jgi:mRNA interferase MazF
VVKRLYVPEAGDLVWLTFDPQRGREQRGRRPALILSPRIYNVRTQLAVACPITSHAKGYPFEVPVTGTEGIDGVGVILADHLKSLDWKERRAEFAGTLPAPALADVRDRVRALLAL